MINNIYEQRAVQISGKYL